MTHGIVSFVNRIITFKFSRQSLPTATPLESMFQRGFVSSSRIDDVTYDTVWIANLLKCNLVFLNGPTLLTLKAYSQISYRGRSQKFWNLTFLHLFVGSPKKARFLKGILQQPFPYEIIAIFVREFIQHRSLWSSANAHNHA